MTYPVVSVREISNNDEVSELLNPSKKIELGKACVDDFFNNSLEEIKQKKEKIFLLEWIGGRIPRGAKLLNHEISWAQHNLVYNTDSEIIGTYERIKDDEKGRKMIVFFNPE